MMSGCLDNHVFGEGLGKEARRISRQRMWVVIAQGRVYLHRG